VEEKYISSPRPLLQDEPEKNIAGKEIVVIGSVTSGIVIRIGRDGLEFNGYYAGLTEPVKYSNLREYGFISWADLNKFRRNMGKKGKAKTRTADEVEDVVDKKYLKNLPIVKMNGKNYYIDTENSQLRPVDDPKKVYYFKDKPGKKPS
jgi:hypothetical protein